MLPKLPKGIPTLGFQVIDWIEAMLVHGPGDVQGHAIHLDDERALHLLWLFAIYPKGHPLEGQRMVLRDVLSRPKGWAKSELAGEIACALALGPVRFDGWDARGEPVGRPVTYPFVRCLATEEEQSGNTYDNVAYMLTEGAAADEYALDVGLTRTFIREPGGGEIRPSTAASSSKDGGKESGAIADETHLYISRELKAMHRTVARNTGKRRDAEPLMIDTTTAYEPGELSVAELAAEHYGAIPVEQCVQEHRVLYDHHEGPPVKNWNSDAQLKAALKKAYGGAASFMDFNRLLALIRAPEATEAESRRYFLNQATAGDRIWVTPALVKALVELGKDIIVKPGELITLGFDGSRFHDATVLIGCRVRDYHVFPIAIWEKPHGEAGRGWEVPTHEVDAAVEYAFTTWRVERGYFDQPFWWDDVARWHARFGDAIATFNTASDAKMAHACGHTRTMIRRQACSIGGDPLLVARLVEHLCNARTRKVKVKLEDIAEQAHVIEKDRKGSPRKIDGATGTVLAVQACTDAIDDGALDRIDPPDPSLYRMEFV